jgi:hypothetical protein
MVEYLQRDPYQVGRDSGLQRRAQQSDREALRDMQDLERASAEAKMTNDAALDRNIRSMSQGSPLRAVGQPQPAQPTGGQQPAQPMQATPAQQPAVGPSSQQPPSPQPVTRRSLASTYMQTPGHAAKGAQMSLDQDAQDVQVFDQTMKYIAAGQPDMAQQYAKRFGEAIPDNILSNANAQRDLADTWTKYSKLYEGRPRDLKQAMETAMREIVGRHFKPGQQAPANQFGYQGLPQPQEMLKTDKTTQPASVQTAEWLVTKGVAKDAREAWQMMSTAKSSPYARAQVVQRLFTAMSADFQDQRSAEEKWAEAQTMVNELISVPQTNGAAPAPSTPTRRYVPGKGFVQ